MTQATAVGPPVTSVLLERGGRRLLVLVVLPLLALAAAAWALTAWQTQGMADGRSPATGPFVASWVVMMAAMMLPAVAPVVALYAQAARRGVVAALPFFVAGYLLVWALSALPALLVARQVAMPMMEGKQWVGRLAGAALVLAAAYELSPAKRVCLRHCRSPLGVFLSRRGSLASPRTALLAGGGHGLYCLGCCWALMAVLMAVGGMQLAWALGLALVVSAEKLLPRGELVVQLTAVACAAAGAALLWSPDLLAHVTT